MSLMYLLAVLNLLVAFQSSFLALHYWVRKRHMKVPFLLFSGICCIVAIVCFNAFLRLPPLGFEWTLMEKSSNASLWILSPSLYLLIAWRLKGRVPLSWKNHLLFYSPVLLVTLVINDPNVENILMLCGFVQMLSYGWLIVWMIFKHRKGSELNRVYWLLPTVAAFYLVVLGNILLNVLRSSTSLELNKDIQMGFTFLFILPVYLLNYREMNTTGVLHDKYEKSPLTEDKLETYADKIVNFLETEKGFCDPDISIRKTSQTLGISEKYISQIVNDKFRMTFKAYVTHLRIAKVKEELLDPSNAKITVGAIGFDAGFKSESTFFHQFKKQTGLTPGEFLKQQAVQKNS